MGPSRAQMGGPKPGPSQKFGTQTNQKNKNYQNQNLCRPKCRQGLDSPEKEPPSPIWGHPRHFFAWARKIEKMTKFRLFSLVGPRWNLHYLNTDCHVLGREELRGNWIRSIHIFRQVRDDWNKLNLAMPVTLNPLITYRICWVFFSIFFFMFWSFWDFGVILKLEQP